VDQPRENIKKIVEQEDLIEDVEVEEATTEVKIDDI